MSDKTALVLLSEILQSVGSVREIFDRVFEEDNRELIEDYYNDLDDIENSTKALIDKCLEVRPFHGYSLKQKQQ